MFLDAITAPFGLAAASLTLPGTLELASLTAASMVTTERPRADPARCRKLAVVVPAHDEEAGIAACVESLQRAVVPPNGRRIVVVADNCSDSTASVAGNAGAEVLIRNDAERRGKGYALELAFDHVLQDPEVEAVLVVDADTEVEANFFMAAAATFAAGADGMQCRYLPKNPDYSTKTRLLNVAQIAFNVARPRGREAMGLSVGILGNGFGLHRRVLAELPYTARSVVEDLEYHLMMVRAGFSMRFVEETAVLADLPTSEEGARTQRERWEGGRFRMIREFGPQLLQDVLAGNARMVEPLGELLLLPLATHVGLLGATLLIPYTPTQIYAAAALGVVGAHVASALYVGGGSAEDAAALKKVPLYVLQKATVLPSLLRASSKEQEWVRTAR